MKSQKQKIVLIILTAILLLIVYHIPREWLYNDSNLVCIHKNLFGIECPFCGMSRAVYELIHFNFSDTAQRNFVAIPFILAYFCWMTAIISENTIVRKAAWIMTYISAVGFVIIYVLRISGLY